MLGFERIAYAWISQNVFFNQRTVLLGNGILNIASLPSTLNFINLREFSVRNSKIKNTADLSMLLLLLLVLLLLVLLLLVLLLLVLLLLPNNIGIVADAATVDAGVAPFPRCFPWIMSEFFSGGVFSLRILRHRSICIGRIVNTAASETGWTDWLKN